MRRTVIEELVAAVAFLLVAIQATWPLARLLGVATSDPGDPYINTWILRWDHYALTTRPLELFHGNVFFPEPLTLAFSENILGISLVTLPLYLAGAKPLVVHNVALILGFAFTGWAGWLFGRIATGSRLAGAVSGLVFMLVPWRFTHLPHLQHLWAGWLPLMFVALLVVSRRPTWGRAALLGGAFLMNGLTNLHWFAFGSFALVLALPLAAAREDRLLDRRFWGRVVVALSVASILLLPILLPYREAGRVFDLRGDREETLSYSARPSDWLVPDPALWMYGELGRTTPGDEELRLFPGFVAILLSLAALLLPGTRTDGSRVPAFATPAGREHLLLRTLDVLIVIALVLALLGGMSTRRLEWEIFGFQILSLRRASEPIVIGAALLMMRLWIRYPGVLAWNHASWRATVRHSRFPGGLQIAILLVVTGFLGSLGLHFALHEVLFEHTALFRGIRAPARWAMLAYLGLAILAGAGTVALAERFRGWRRVAIATGVVLAVFVELDLRQIRWHLGPDETPPVYEWLKGADLQGAVIELPFDQPSHYRAMLGAAQHLKPVVNGASGFKPPRFRELEQILAQEPIPVEILDILVDHDVRLLIVHADPLGDRSLAIRRFVTEGIESGRLHFLARFEEGVRGALVFSIGKQKAGLSLTHPRAHLDRGQLETFLAGDWQCNHGGFGIVDAPTFWSTVTGPLEIRGWAFSGSGIRHVDALLQNRAIRIPLERVSAPGLSARFSCYDGIVDEPRFGGLIASRPRGVSRQTDLQIEIVPPDETVSRLPQIWFSWEKEPAAPR